MIITKLIIAKLLMSAALIGGGVLDGPVSTRQALHAAPWVRERNPIARAVGASGPGLYVSLVDTGLLTYAIWKFKPNAEHTQGKMIRDFLWSAAGADALGHWNAAINNFAVARRESNRFNYACSLGWNPPPGWACK